MCAEVRMYSPTFFQFFPFVAFGLWLAVVVFMVVMTTRLVKGVERIAGALERR